MVSNLMPRLQHPARDFRKPPDVGAALEESRLGSVPIQDIEKARRSRARPIIEGESEGAAARRTLEHRGGEKRRSTPAHSICQYTGSGTCKSAARGHPHTSTAPQSGPYDLPSPRTSSSVNVA